MFEAVEHIPVFVSTQILQHAVTVFTPCFLSDVANFKIYFNPSILTLSKLLHRDQ